MNPPPAQPPVPRQTGHPDALPEQFKRKTTIAVIDFQEHTRGGHFGAWHLWFAREFASRFDDVLVVSPNPSALQSLFRATIAHAPENLSFHALPEGLKRSFALAYLRELPVPQGSTLHAFVMWSFDLLSLQASHGSGEIPWAGLVSISWSERGHSNQSAQMERTLVRFFNEDRACRAFVQPDGYLGDRVAKAHWIPDLENVSLHPRETALATKIREHKQGQFCIGAFGILAGYRCLDGILPLVVQHPEIRFVLAGRILETTVRPELLPLLREKKPPNLTLMEGFIEGEAELNAVIHAVDALFIDGVRYPVQSGIVCRAMHFGKCIITPESNSWTRDVVNQWQVGIIYHSPAQDLSSEWRSWCEAGGPGKSVNASHEMRKPENVARCFDAVSQSLIGA